VAAIRTSPPKRDGQDERVTTKKKRPAHLRYAALVLGSVSVTSLACALSASPAMAQVVNNSQLFGATATTDPNTGAVTGITITDSTNGSELTSTKITGDGSEITYQGDLTLTIKTVRI
jgi:hypothetical protein